MGSLRIMKRKGGENFWGVRVEGGYVILAGKNDEAPVVREELEFHHRTPIRFAHLNRRDTVFVADAMT